MNLAPNPSSVVQYRPLDFSSFEWLTFDCYGTLIDWEAGILRIIRLALPGINASDADILRHYSEIEPAIQAKGYAKYREVLEEVTRQLARRYRMPITPTQAGMLAESIKNWQPFPDTVAGLKRLKSRFKLGIISNIDDDLFAGTAQWLEVEFDAVITAEQVGAYKPSKKNFEVALERTGVDRAKLLHCAESLYHDVAPTNEMGIANVWVNRRIGRSAEGATLVPQDVKPWLMVPDIATLAAVALGDGKT